MHIVNTITKLNNAEYMDALFKHIHTNINYLILLHVPATCMCSPCNIEWIQTPHKIKFGTLDFETIHCIHSVIHIITQHLGTYTVTSKQF